MGVNNETLYLKIEQNTIVFDRHVVLNDIAKMECTHEAGLRQVKQKKIYRFTKQKEEKKEKKNAFFFKEEDGIRDLIVTGVQTCALPICL